MIQRIQTLWLLIAAAFAFLSLKLSFFAGQKIVNEVAAHVELNAATADNLLVLISSVAVGLLALIAVFLFKQRKPQLRLVIVALLLSIVNIVLFIMEAQKFIPHQGNYSLTSVFVFLIPVFLILAARGISKDEKLIKSLDRLR
jgi:uncharacterized membrane-anchored protein